MCFDTKILISVTKPLTSKSDTSSGSLLGTQGDGLGREVARMRLLDDDDENGEEELTRVVRNVIPFEVCFELEKRLWTTMNVSSDHLRLSSALLETSVLSVDAGASPLADALLEFVTIIPLPLFLSGAVRFLCVFRRAVRYFVQGGPRSYHVRIWVCRSARDFGASRWPMLICSNHDRVIIHKYFMPLHTQKCQINHWTFSLTLDIRLAPSFVSWHQILC